MTHSSRRIGTVGWLSAALLGGACGAALMVSPSLWGGADARPIAIAPPAGAPMSFADLIDRVSPAVVSLAVTTSEADDSEEMAEMLDRFRDLPGFEDFMRRRGEQGQRRSTPREGRSLGSGFFISADGVLITNNHVVENSKKIMITSRDGEEYEAELIGRDEATDLAVLKVKDTKGRSFPYVQFARDDELRIGDWVVAVGNPFGLGHTATAGIVSANQREIAGGGSYTDFVQIDAPINRGNSGGPTFDLTGRVVGVNTAIFSPSGGSVGIGFMIPSDLAASVSDQIVKNGKVVRGWLGVTIQSVTTEMADGLGLKDAKGALIAEVTADGPASKAGLQRGDIVLKVNGADVKDSRDLTRKVGLLQANSRNSFEVLRDNKKMSVQVTVGERPGEAEAAGLRPDREPEKPAEPEAKTGPFGGSYRPADADDRKELGLESDEPALLVTEVDEDSALEEAGIEAGQALLLANGRPLSSIADLEAAAKAARDAGRKNLVLAVRIPDRTLFLTVSLEQQ